MKQVTMGKNALLAHLKDIEMFQYLHQWEREKMLPICEVLVFQPGETLISPSEKSLHFFGIFEGTVVISVEKSGGKEVPVNTVTKGQVVGEAAIFVDVSRTAKVVARDLVQIVRIERRHLLSFIRNNADTGLKILMYMVYSLIQKLRDANQDLALQKPTVVDVKAVEMALHPPVLDDSVESSE